MAETETQETSALEAAVEELTTRVREGRQYAEHLFAPGHTRDEYLRGLDAIDTVLAALAQSRADSERLDWLDEHAATVEVEDTDDTPCTVQSNLDCRLSGHANTYSIRTAIDAARAVTGREE